MLSCCHMGHNIGVLFLGSHGYNALYYRLIINDCLDSGTQLPFIKRAMSVSQTDSPEAWFLTVGDSRLSWMMMFLLREWEINPRKKSRIQVHGIRTQNLLNTTSQTLLSLSHLDPWQRSGRQATYKQHKQHCLEASAEFQLILTLSELDWTETLAELSNLWRPSCDRSPPSSPNNHNKFRGLMFLTVGDNRHSWEINPQK